MIRELALAALLALAATAPASAAAPSETPSASSTPSPAQAAAAKRAQQKAMDAFEAGLVKRTGDIELKAAGAVLHLGDGYYWLDNANAKKVLVDAWGNPPQAAEDVIGMIFPAGSKTVDEDVWGAVVTYEGEGYVSDTDAQKLDYDKLLEQMREGEQERNAERVKAGFENVSLVGWAQRPAYDAGRHSLIWARRLKFAGQSEDTVNYDVRILGRGGVLSLNIVGAVSQLDTIRPAGEALQGVAAFQPGKRYADYKPGVDKKAAYGIGGLILAGAGLAAVKKVGFLAVALIFLKKGAVVVIGLAVAAFGWFRRRFGRKARTIELQTPPERKDDDPNRPWS